MSYVNYHSSVGSTACFHITRQVSSPDRDEGGKAKGTMSDA